MLEDFPAPLEPDFLGLPVGLGLPDLQARVLQFELLELGFLGFFLFRQLRERPKVVRDPEAFFP